MTDQELIERAAVTAGFGSKHKTTGELQFCWTQSEYPLGSGKEGAIWNYVGYMDTAELWNPLTCYSDALTLAVKLNMNLQPTTVVSTAKGPHAKVTLGTSTFCEPHGTDPVAALCRAIVNAAVFQDEFTPALPAVEPTASEELRRTILPKQLSYTLDDFWAAPSNEGDLANTWKDKPHRLVYDLIAAVLYYSTRAMEISDIHRCAAERLRGVIGLSDECDETVLMLNAAVRVERLEEEARPRVQSQEAACDEYFKDRPQLDFIGNRRIFESGFRRGHTSAKITSWNLALAEAAEVCDGLSKLFTNKSVGFDVGYTMAVERAAADIRKLSTEQDRCKTAWVNFNVVQRVLNHLMESHLDKFETTHAEKPGDDGEAAAQNIIDCIERIASGSHRE